MRPQPRTTTRVDLRSYEPAANVLFKGRTCSARRCFVERMEAARGRSDTAGDNNGSGDAQSVVSSLEHLLDGAQGVITKRIDLALLEGEDLLSYALGRAALTAAAMMLAVTAWLAGAGALVLFVMPDTNPVVRLAVLALLNGGAGLGLVALATRHRRPLMREPVPAEEGTDHEHA